MKKGGINLKLKTVCPKCLYIPFIQLLKEHLQIKIICKCGYEAITTINQYLSEITKINNEQEEIITNNITNMYCSIHEDDVLRNYCFTCQKNCCLEEECLLNHESHYTINLIKFNT